MFQVVSSFLQKKELEKQNETFLPQKKHFIPVFFINLCLIFGV